MTALLALDLGTKTGFAVRANGAIAFGVQDFTPSRFDSGAMRFIRFRKFLMDLHAQDPIGFIGYEEVRAHAGTGAAHVYGGFMAVLQVFGSEHGVAYEAYPVGTIKKFWTGSGNASKDRMIAVAKQMGFETTDDNAADALAILHLMEMNAVTL